MSLSAAAIRRPVATTMVCVGVVLLGVVSFGGLTVDLLPDIGTPRITLITSAVGLAPTEIESEITKKIENAVSAVQGQLRVTSVCYFSQSRDLKEMRPAPPAIRSLPGYALHPRFEV